MIHIGSIRGTTIAIDLSFMILAALFVMNYYDPRLGIHYALLWIPVLFLSILIHEFAHAATIGAFGFGSSEIVLGGIGGVTMNRRQARPWQDMLISVAGPASSFLLSFICGLLYMNVRFFQTDPMMRELMPLMSQVNFFWGIFNCLPITPLDGGHALRDLLRMFLPDRRAFPIAVWIGMLVGIAAAVYFARYRAWIGVFLMAWYVFMNYQQWQYYKDHGTPGD